MDGDGRRDREASSDAARELAKAYRELKDSHIEMIFRMALMAEFREPAMGTHLVRISDYSTIIAEGVGLPRDEVEVIRYASPMHDIGKIMLPDAILKKNDILTSEELSLVRKHAIVGADIFKNARSPILRACRVIALTHHERYDGSGYPEGLKGDEIPLYGRIVALADCFDAYTSPRPYKEAFGFERSVSMVKERAGTHFDPVLVKAFVREEPRIQQVWQANRDISTFLKDMGIADDTLVS